MKSESTSSTPQPSQAQAAEGEASDAQGKKAEPKDAASSGEAPSATAPRQGTEGALLRAQQLIWAPLIFQAAKQLRDRGIFAHLIRAKQSGLSPEQLSQKSATSLYGVKVLLEAGLAGELVHKQGENYFITTLGQLLERDEMSRVNMNFVADVCYRSAAHLGASIDEVRPAGLHELSSADNVYQGLQDLAEPAKTSWFEYDHYYSDISFPLILREVMAQAPKRVLDVGCNTGKFAERLLSYAPEVQVTGADLPVQIAVFRKNLKESFGARVEGHAIDLLDPTAALPGGFDVIWMSQFLCCFSEDEVLSILQRAQAAMEQETRFLVLDTFWDQQDSQVAELNLQAVSLYFTSVANGKGRMYDSATLQALVRRAGLEVVKVEHGLGWGHSLYELRKV